MLNQGQKISAYLIIFFLISIYTFVLSDSGMLMRNQLKGKKQIILKRIQALNDKNNELIKKNNDILQGKISKQELLNSGYITYGDKVLFLKGKEEKKKSKNIIIDEDDEFGIHLNHMRLFWIIFSIICLLLYFSIIFCRNNKRVSESSYE